MFEFWISCWATYTIWLTVGDNALFCFFLLGDKIIYGIYYASTTFLLVKCTGEIPNDTLFVAHPGWTITCTGDMCLNPLYKYAILLEDIFADKCVGDVLLLNLA